MQTPTPQRILIAGGGLGGLTLALELLAAGFEVEVYERAQALSEVGAGITLWENALKVMRHVGLSDALAAAGAPLGDAMFATADGQKVSDVGKSTYAPYDPTFEILGIHRADLQAILMDALPDGVVHLGRRVTGIMNHSDRAGLRFEDGGEVWGDLLVGADGIRSQVRAGLLADGPPRYAGYTCWRAVVDDWPERGPFLGEVWGQGTRIGLMGIGKGRLYWYATANTPQGRPKLEPRACHTALRERFASHAWGIPDLIERTSPDAILRNDIVDRPPKRPWSRGRVVLIGDACHPTTPNMGMGAALAIEDGAVLTNALVRFGADYQAAFQAFEDARYPRTSRIQNLSWRLGQVGQLEGAWLCAARNLVFSNIPTRLTVKQTLEVGSYDATQIMTPL